MNGTTLTGYSTQAIIDTNEREDVLPCIAAGCDLDAGDPATDSLPWVPVWHMSGAVFLGMDCGGH